MKHIETKILLAELRTYYSYSLIPIAHHVIVFEIIDERVFH